MDIEPKKILVVAAHPDDEVLGSGGTIARMANEGNDVFVGILGEGITSRYKKRGEADTESIKELQKQSRQVAKLLGVQNLYMFSLPDNRFDTIPFLDIVKIIEELIENLKPAVIYTHYAGDLNIDHAITHRAVLTSARPIKGHPVKEIYAFEILSSTEWAFGQYKGVFNPNVFINISETINLKLKGMEIYRSEACHFPHPRSRKSIKATATRWGSVVGTDVVEAFELIRHVR